MATYEISQTSYSNQCSTKDLGPCFPNPFSGSNTLFITQNVPWHVEYYLLQWKVEQAVGGKKTS